MAIIEFMNAKNKTYVAMKKVLDYIVKPTKTMEHLIGGQLCNPDLAFYEFVLTKQRFNKEVGRQYIHFTQSFSPQDKITPEMAFEIAEKLLEHESFQGYQVKFATHIDKEHLHTHFIINTVNTETGNKWQQSPKELQSLKDYSDSLCREYGLIIVDGEKKKHKNRGEYRTEQKGTSWKKELFLAVKKCKYLSTSKEDFIKNMNQLGIEVNWTDDRKYITFINAEGKKCRNRTLYPQEEFTKEALLLQFQLNVEQENQTVLKERVQLMAQVIQMIDSDFDNDHSNYPLQHLEKEGQAWKDKIEELKKGKGIEWGHDFE